MATSRTALKLSRHEVSDAFTVGDWVDSYPPILTVDQASNLLGVPKSTVYAWHSEGRLRGCAQRLGKHLRFFRDRLVLKLMNEGI